MFCLWVQLVAECSRRVYFYVHIFCDIDDWLLCLSTEADRAAMAQYAKNFLPLLFNAFTSDPQQSRDSRRLAVLETIKVYLSVTDPKVTVHWRQGNCSVLETITVYASVTDAKVTVLC